MVVQSQVTAKLLECMGLVGVMARRCSWLAHIPSMGQSSPMLRSAVLTACILHIGTVQNDHRALEAGRKRYSTVVASLGLEIAKPKSSLREIILTILLVDLCDGPLAGVKIRPDLSATHYNGAQLFVSTYGLANFDIADPLNRVVLTKLRKVAFFTNTARRKGSKSARKLAKQRDRQPGPLSLLEWFNMASPLPGLLEDADKILSQEQNCKKVESALMALCLNLETLRLDLLLELDLQTGNAESIEMRFRDSIVEEHRFMSSSEAASIISTMYNFDGFHQAGRHAFTWLSVLVIDCTLLRIHRRQPFVRLFPGATPRSPTMLKRHALERAFDICRSIHFFSGLSSLAHANFTKVLLEVVVAFFTEIEAVKPIQWSLECLAANSQRIDRLERTGHQSLCRVAGMSEGLASIVRFGSDDHSPAEGSSDSST